MGLDRQSLDDVLQPVDRARGLPNAHYTDPAVFASERDAVFGSGWAAIGYTHDVPEAADAKPLTFLDQPLLLVRGRDEVVRVFFNVCRHRGMILVSEPRKMRGVIRCPYHSWCYDLTGKLKTTPHVGGPGHNTHAAIERDVLGLLLVSW